MTSFDVIVIGGGHNGLVAATALARSGRKGLVLEAASEVGGAARTEEFFAGFRVSSIAHVLNRLHPEVIKTLELEKHGLELTAGVTPTPNPSPQGGGRFFDLSRPVSGEAVLAKSPLPLEGRG